jgi:hypothetical protein
MSGSKSARLQNSIVNRTNVCGGVKKAGTAPSVGIFLLSNVLSTRAVTSNPRFCIPSVSPVVQTQRTGYKATLGG